MKKLTKFEVFQIAAIMLSGSELFNRASNPNKVSRLLSLVKELENRQDEEVDPEKKNVTTANII